MVLQQTHRQPGAQVRLDSTRILGISGTLALNALAMLFLLAPTTVPRPAPEGPVTSIVDIIPIKPIQRPPPPPEQVKVVRPQTSPQPVQVPRMDTPPVAEPVIVDHGTVPVDLVAEAPTAEAGPVDIAPSAPVSGMQLTYAHAPAPVYPRDAVRRGLEGTVMLRVLVDVDGRPLDVQVHRSSGHAILDREAQRQVLRQWTFQPATKDGHAVQAIGIIPIDFTLGRM